MSAAGRKAIAEAQRKRWAAAKGESAAPKVIKKQKRRLSAAGKANISRGAEEAMGGKKGRSCEIRGNGKEDGTDKAA